MRELSVGSRGLEYAGGGNLNSDWVEVDDNGLLCLRYFSIDYPLGAVAESVGREVDSCNPSSVLAERMLARPRCHCISGRFFKTFPSASSTTFCNSIRPHATPNHDKHAVPVDCLGSSDPVFWTHRTT